MLYRFADCALDVDRRELHRAGVPVPIEPQVFDLLLHLIRHRDRVVGKNELLASIWHGRVVSESAFFNRVNAARRAIGDTGAQQCLIRTLPRKGLRFVGDVHEARMSASAAAAPPVAAANGAAPPDSAMSPDKPSIAVLPFVGSAGSPDEDYVGDGVAEEIIRLLSRMRWLFVIAGYASSVCRGKDHDTRQVGRGLGVRYLVQGRIRCTAKRVRISYQMVEAATGNVLWSDRHDGVPADIFALQDRVATAVAAAIEPRVEMAEIHRAAVRPTADWTAYDLYMRALPHTYSWERERIVAAMALLRQARERDPHFALALANEAFCYCQLANNGWAPPAGPGATDQAALDLADRALRADPDDPAVMGCVAMVRGFFGRDLGGCIELVDRALELNPSFAVGWKWSGFLRLHAGEFDTAIDHFHQSLRLSPGRERWNGACRVGIGMARFFRGEFAVAASLLERAIDELPTFATGYRFLAASCAHLGDWEGARQALARLGRPAHLSRAPHSAYHDSEHGRLYASGLALAIEAARHERVAVDITARRVAGS